MNPEVENEAGDEVESEREKEANRVIPPRSGTAFRLARGERLTIIDPEGEQVADLICYAAGDPAEYLSSGRSLDYAGKLMFSTGDILYSNRSRGLLAITEDSVGRHDFLLTPCSAETFRILYGDGDPHRGCHGNLAEALRPYGIPADQIPVTFNVFMHVDISMPDGKMSVLPPLSKAGDYFTVEALEDLIVGLTACSAGQSNNFSYKPIHYTINSGLT